MAVRWRLADGMTLTHLENGGWALADLHRLSVHELDEENGALLDEAAIESGIIIDSKSATNAQERPS